MLLDAINNNIHACFRSCFLLFWFLESHVFPRLFFNVAHSLCFEIGDNFSLIGLPYCTPELERRQYAVAFKDSEKECTIQNCFLGQWSSEDGVSVYF